MRKRAINSIFAAVSISLVGNLLAMAINRAEAAPVDKSGAQSKKVAPVKSSASEVVSATEKFGLDLFQKLSAEKAGENCFISPASVAIALNFAMAGSSGSTREAMCKGLRLDNPQADTSSAFSELLKSLVSTDDKVEMNIANAIFVNDKYKLNASFEQNAKANFQSEIRNENFSDTQTLNKINAWVSDKTKKHIPSIISKLPAEAFAVLLNAIYFKGSWSTPFPSNATQDGDFHLESGGTKKVSFMKRTGKFSYFEEKDFQAVKIPYGSERFEAIVFLPAPSVKLSEFQKKMTAKNWNGYLEKFDSFSDSHLTLPRFHIDYSKTLNQSLQSMGFETMFSDRADFSLMHTPPPALRVSEVIHKTTLDVDEKGTVATAATSVMMMPMAVRMNAPKSFTMVVNRPFLFAIRDNETKFLLFFGSVHKPEKKEN